MSVPEGKRSKGKLAIETEAFKFLDYIFSITTRYYQPLNPPKDIPEDALLGFYAEYEQGKWFAEKMRNSALDCLSQLQEANRIMVKSDEEQYERRKHQDNGERALENLLSAATVMYRKKMLKSKRLKTIGTQTADLKRMIQNWRKSDKRRFESARK